jgi:hypothetical protein
MLGAADLIRFPEGPPGRMSSCGARHWWAVSASWMCSRTPWRGRGRVRHVRHRGRRGRGREELIGGGGRGGGPRWGARGVEACTLVDRLTPYRPFTQALAATVRAWSLIGDDASVGPYVAALGGLVPQWRGPVPRPSPSPMVVAESLLQGLVRAAGSGGAVADGVGSAASCWCWRTCTGAMPRPALPARTWSRTSWG